MSIKKLLEERKMKGKDPCWKGYEMIGMKDKNGKKVPNCVPEETEVFYKEDLDEQILALDEMPGANMDTRAVHQHLKKSGWSLTRTSGGHDIYSHPDAKHTIPVPRHRQLKAPLVLGILKSSKLRKEEVELDEAKGEMSKDQIMKKINNGTHEAMTDVVPGKHVELRHVATGKKLMVFVKHMTEEVELDEAIKINSKVKMHAPGKDYHDQVGYVGEIRHGAYKGAPKTYTVDYGDRKSVQLDKNSIKLHKEEALKGKQHKLDVDKDGKIEGEDLAKLRSMKEDEIETSDYKTDKRGRKYRAHRVVFNKGEEEMKEQTELDEAIKPYVSGDHASGWTILNSKGKEVKTFHHSDYADHPIKDKKAAAKNDAMAYLKKHFNKLSEGVELDERELSDVEMKKREKYVKGMKKSYKDFVSQYGPDRAKSVMYATATKMAKEEVESVDESEAYQKDMDKNKPVFAQGVKGMKSTPFVKKFKSQEHYERWADSDAAGDHEVHRLYQEEVEFEELAESSGMDEKFTKAKGDDKPFATSNVDGTTVRHYKSDDGYIGHAWETKNGQMQYHEHPYKGEAHAKKEVKKQVEFHNEPAQLKSQLKSKAYDLLRKDRKMSEEVENIDELSKSTLGSYIRKASGNAASATRAAGVEAGASGPNRWANMDSKEKRAEKRLTGVSKAVDRLTKEEHIVESFELMEGMIERDDFDDMLAARKKNSKVIDYKHTDNKAHITFVDGDGVKRTVKYTPTGKSMINHGPYEGGEKSADTKEKVNKSEVKTIVRGRGRPRKDKFAESVNILLALSEEEFDEIMEGSSLDEVVVSLCNLSEEELKELKG